MLIHSRVNDGDVCTLLGYNLELTLVRLPSSCWPPHNTLWWQTGNHSPASDPAPAQDTPRSCHAPPTPPVPTQRPPSAGTVMMSAAHPLKSCLVDKCHLCF